MLFVGWNMALDI